MRALVVLGSSLGGTRRLLVATAERAARARGVDLVVLTGWSPEATHMRELWHGPESVEVVVEETASTTAENAARTLPLLLERGVTDAIVVCAPLHLARARWIFRQVYAGHGVDVRFRVARIWPTPGALMWELGALTVAARQVRTARAEQRRR